MSEIERRDDRGSGRTFGDEVVGLGPPSAGDAR